MQRPTISYSIPLTPVVKSLILVNLGIWLVFQIILEGYGHIPFGTYFSLYPSKVVFDFYVWQLFTYSFLHALQVSHILFNMLMLWFVGGELELKWGSRFFLIFYLLSGTGAAVLYVLISALYSAWTGNKGVLFTPVVGASGSIFGLFVAYGLIFGDRIIHFMMLFPMKAKHFVLLLGGIEVVSLLTAGVVGSEVANLAHLGGIVSGYLILKSWGHWQRWKWNYQLAQQKKKRNLRLVIDNDDSEKQRNNKGPKFWN